MAVIKEIFDINHKKNHILHAVGKKKVHPQIVDLDQKGFCQRAEYFPRQ